MGRLVAHGTTRSADRARHGGHLRPVAQPDLSGDAAQRGRSVPLVPCGSRWRSCFGEALIAVQVWLSSASRIDAGADYRAHRLACRAGSDGSAGRPASSAAGMASQMPIERYLISAVSSILYFEPSAAVRGPILSTSPNGATSVEMVIPVDADDAVFQRLGDAPDAADVAGVEIRGEAEGRRWRGGSPRPRP